MARKSSASDQEKIGDVMHEFKRGKLKSGSGEKITNRKQAIDIPGPRKMGPKIRAKAER